jgi:uncharacterized protein
VNIVVAGGTGFIGKALCETLCRSGHRLTILTRRPATVERLFESQVKAVEWDALNAGTWERSLREAQGVINLTGAGIADARWTDRRKRVLIESRLLPTRLLVEACARSSVKPQVFISASGSTALRALRCSMNRAGEAAGFFPISASNGNPPH